MEEVSIEIVGSDVIVYRPGTSMVTLTVLALDEALALARIEWPDFEIRVIVSTDVRDLIKQLPAKCAQCG